uniref:Arsenite methyltransferase n=1 Tax=Talaromyces marneffei PM1 TaxID=1077442 RepID=A0A093VIP1_TALMA
MADTYQLVQSSYGDIAKKTATNPEQDSEKNIAMAFGYTEEDLLSLPEKTNLGLSCGNPVAYANVKEGETVVDLGSGGGIDVFLAAHKNMIDLATKNANASGLSNTSFIEASITSIPLPDSSVDCIISNCVINLVPTKDKSLVFHEIARLLKPGGRLAVSDILARKELPESIANDMTLYVGCIAGASQVVGYEEYLRQAGFQGMCSLYVSKITLSRRTGRANWSLDIFLVDTKANLNIYKEFSYLQQSTCCAPSSCSEQAKTQSAEIDYNEWAGSFQIYAVKPSYICHLVSDEILVQEKSFATQLSSASSLDLSPFSSLLSNLVTDIYPPSSFQRHSQGKCSLPSASSPTPESPPLDRRLNDILRLVESLQLPKNHEDRIEEYDETSSIDEATLIVRENMGLPFTPLEELDNALKDFFNDDPEDLCYSFDAFRMAAMEGKTDVLEETRMRHSDQASTLEALNWQSRSLEGLPTMAEISSTPSADLPKCFTQAKKAAIDVVDGGGSKLGSWEEAKVFMKAFKKLTRPAPWSSELNAAYEKPFDVDLDSICNKKHLQSPLIPIYRPWVRVFELSDVQVENIKKVTPKSVHESI